MSFVLPLIIIILCSTTLILIKYHGSCFVLAQEVQEVQNNAKGKTLEEDKIRKQQQNSQQHNKQQQNNLQHNKQ